MEEQFHVGWLLRRRQGETGALTWEIRATSDQRNPIEEALIRCPDKRELLVRQTINQIPSIYLLLLLLFCLLFNLCNWAPALVLHLTKKRSR